MESKADSHATCKPDNVVAASWVLGAKQVMARQKQGLHMRDGAIIEKFNVQEIFHSAIERGTCPVLFLRRQIRELAPQRKHGIESAEKHRPWASTTSEANVGAVISLRILISASSPERFISTLETQGMDQWVKYVYVREVEEHEIVRNLAGW